MKKKFAILMFILACFPMITQAQDVITKRDGTAIQAIIIEVNQSEIKYKSFRNQDGPLYTIDKNDVVLIQYKNGENEVIQPIVEKNNIVMGIPKYSSLKETINPSGYVHGLYDKYSPGWCGFASFVIPGLGQAIGNEWERAAGFFLGSVALTTVRYINLWTGLINPNYNYNISFIVSIPLTFAALGLKTWSIIDAVRIAKVKNIWYQREMASAFDLHVTPNLTYNPLSNSNNPVMGLTLTLNF